MSLASIEIDRVFEINVVDALALWDLLTVFAQRFACIGIIAIGTKVVLTIQHAPNPLLLDTSPLADFNTRCFPRRGTRKEAYQQGPKRMRMP